MTREVFEDRLHRELITRYDEIVTAERAPAVAAPRPVRRWLRRPAVLGGLAAVVVVAGGAAVAAVTVVVTEREKLTPPAVVETLAPGEEARIKGMGCEPGSTVVVALDGARVGTAITESHGEGPNDLVIGYYLAVFAIPADTPPGPHVLTFTCPYIGGGPELVQTQEITVAA